MIVLLFLGILKVLMCMIFNVLGYWREMLLFLVFLVEKKFNKNVDMNEKFVIKKIFF